VQTKALGDLEKLYKQFDNDPAGYIRNKNPNLTIPQVQAELNNLGVGFKSAIPNNDPIIFGIKNDMVRIGAISKDKDLKTIYQETDDVLKKWLPAFGTKEQFIKEAKYHFEGLDLLIAQSRLEGNPISDKLIQAKAEANRQELKKLPSNLSERDEKAKIAEFKDTKAGQYEYYRSLKYGDKMGKALVEYANYSGLSMKELTKEIYKDKEFIVSDKVHVNVNTTKYKRNDIEQGINRAILEIPKERTGKYDLQANIEVIDDDNGNLYFQIKDKYGNKDYIKTIKTDELPQTNVISFTEKQNQEAIKKYAPKVALPLNQ
jgi:hypothetical protein